MKKEKEHVGMKEREREREVMEKNKEINLKKTR